MIIKNLFDKWKTKTPKYIKGNEDLFELLAKKFGAEGERRISHGKHFSTYYELYIYAFFLGLYKNELLPIKDGEKKIDFSHSIQHWGSKTNLSRKDFTNLQENIFMALIAKTDIDIISLEKGEIEEEEIVKSLIKTMESYTNGGLNLIREKHDDNQNYFLQPTSFLNMILESDTSVSVDATSSTS